MTGEDASVAEDAAVVDAGDALESGAIKGRLRFSDGSSVGGVEVTAGGKRLATDNRGLFELPELPSGKHSIVVTDPTSSAAQADVDVKGGSTTQVELVVLPMKTLPLPDASAGGEVTDATDGLKLGLPAAALKTRAGSAVTGAAEARYGLVKTSQDVRAAPGGLRAKMGGQDVQLETFGMLDLRFYQDDEALELAEEIEVTLPLGPNAYADGDAIDVWSFDPESGTWQSEAMGLVDKSAGGNGAAILKVSHLSWWCVAEPVSAPTCLAGQVLNANDEPVPDVWVNAVGIDYWGSFWAASDDQGNFCVPVKAGSSNSVSAFGSSAASYYDWEKQVTAGSEPAACGADGCTDVGVFAPRALFDECSGNVSSGQDHVLVLSSGDEALDTALLTRLEELGQEATLGPEYTEFTDTTDLTPYDAVYLQANANWASGDMPELGQRKLINWVNCGGGLVTVEWTTWKIGSAQEFELIDAIFPAARTADWGSPTTETFTQVTDDPTLNAGLPESFTFTTSSYDGVESYLNPRPGAAIYYDSLLDSGLLGWEYNLGRVASFSLVVGGSEIADSNFSRLIANTINWVQRE